MNNDHEKDISNFDFNRSNFSNDYKILVQKLKSIKETISLLEKNFLEKER